MSIKLSIDTEGLFAQRRNHAFGHNRSPAELLAKLVRIHERQARAGGRADRWDPLRTWYKMLGACCSEAHDKNQAGGF